MNDPNEPYLLALKHIFCYLQDTLMHNLQICLPYTGYFVSYFDVDWVGSP